MDGPNGKLEEWIEEVAPRAIAYAETLLSRPGRAEEIVQDVFLRLLDHPEYDLLRDGDKLLFRSITNACINARSRRKELRSLDRDVGDGTTLGETVSAASGRQPLDALAERELMETVREELRDLSPLHRAAVELKAMGKSLKEIARTLEVSRSNAGVLVHRGRKRLAKKLGNRLPGELR